MFNFATPDKDFRIGLVNCLLDKNIPAIFRYLPLYLSKKGVRCNGFSGM